MNGKKIIKPFDLEAAKNGTKIETRDGREVEILKWDAENTSYPIEGVILRNKATWANNGKWSIADPQNCRHDLVIVEYEDEENPELGGIRAEPEIATGLQATGFQHKTKANSDDYSIELVDCDNGIFLKVHDFNPDAKDVFLVYKREEQEQMLGKFLMDSIRVKMNADLCSKVRIEMKIFSEKE